ncbi:hypothetical protein [Anaerosporobacter sp.]|uniref:hypothetical protein n=1 Tax=Anaerosporobacter sp. TaxID=1872529 RepID=UPI00286F447F|nr:hypothetical protein [Anaerosporobacter sp.]
MGLSGVVLKKKENIDIKKIINDIKLATIKAGLQFRMGKEWKKYEDGTYDYLTVNIANTFEADNQQQILLYVYGKSEDIYDSEYDWIIKEGRLNQVINIEDFSGCEKMLLEFIYEYMTLNQNDIFWDEMEWFYEYKDIQSIYNQKFDNDWCYKSPQKIDAE